MTSAPDVQEVAIPLEVEIATWNEITGRACQKKKKKKLVKNGPSSLFTVRHAFSALPPFDGTSPWFGLL